MPFATIDEQGTQLQYNDSGAPTGSTTYATLVVLHGGCFNSGIFNPMIPYAAASNVRLVLLNARDMGQSTPYTESELKAIHSQDKAIQTDFIRGSIREHAAFLVWYIQHEHIPLFKEDSPGIKTGGICLVGWSAANDLFVPFFAMADAIPAQMRAVIEPYLRKYIMYDCTYYAIGMPDPPLDLVYCPLRDTAMSVEQQNAAFPGWVSGYFHRHAPVVAEALEATDITSFPSRTDFCKGIQRDQDLDGLSPVFQRIPPAQFEEITSMVAFVRSAMPILFFKPEIYADCARTLVYDGDHAKQYFPRVSVAVVNCMQGHGDCMMCAYTIKEMLLKREAQGVVGRKIDVVPFYGVNHMAHWDAPEETVKLFASII